MADVDELARPKDTQKIVQRNAAMSATEQEDAEAPQGESVKLNSVKLPQEAMPVTKTSSQGGLREGRKPWSFKRSSERTEVSAASPSSPSSPSSPASAASPASPSTTEQGRGAFRRRLPWQRKADQSDKDPADAERMSATARASSPLKQDPADAAPPSISIHEDPTDEGVHSATASGGASSPLKEEPESMPATTRTATSPPKQVQPGTSTRRSTSSSKQVSSSPIAHGTSPSLKQARPVTSPLKATSSVREDPADAEALPAAAGEASPFKDPSVAPATVTATSPVKQDPADAEALPTAAREASPFKDPSVAPATARATSPVKQDPADAEALPTAAREASPFKEGHGRLLWCVSPDPSVAPATARATSPVKQDPADAEALPTAAREASPFKDPSDALATARATSPLKQVSEADQEASALGHDGEAGGPEPPEPGEARTEEGLPSLPLQLELRSGTGEDGHDGDRSRSPSWRKLRIRVKQQRIRRRPGSTSPFESLSSRRQRRSESPQSVASAAASAGSPSGGRWTGVPAKAAYPNLSGLRVQKPRLKDLREARRAQEAAERASSRTLPGSVLSPTKQGPIWHRLHQMHKELVDKRTELVERSLKQAEDRERSLRSEHKPRQAAPAEVQLIASKLHSQHQERQEKRQAALQENEKLLARIYSFAPSLSPKTRELVESQGASERFSVLYDDHRRRMALREEICRKKDLEEQRQISENRFHKVERKVALDAIEKLHSDAQLRAQRINEKREQKLQEELKELEAMSIHRQRSRKDLGDAAGAFGHRLFEESKQRQERKQTRALQAQSEAKAAAQPGVGVPGAPTSPRGVLHLYEDAARREESLMERRRKLWETESQEASLTLQCFWRLWVGVLFARTARSEPPLVEPGLVTPTLWGKHPDEFMARGVLVCNVTGHWTVHSDIFDLEQNAVETEEWQSQVITDSFAKQFESMKPPLGCVSHNAHRRLRFGIHAALHCQADSVVSVASYIRSGRLIHRLFDVLYKLPPALFPFEWSFRGINIGAGIDSYPACSSSDRLCNQDDPLDLWMGTLAKQVLLVDSDMSRLQHALTKLHDKRAQADSVLSQLYAVNKATTPIDVDAGELDEILIDAFRGVVDVLKIDIDSYDCDVLVALLLKVEALVIVLESQPLGARWHTSCAY
eukprot:s419_g10.t3